MKNNEKSSKKNDERHWKIIKIAKKNEKTHENNSKQ